MVILELIHSKKSQLLEGLPCLEQVTKNKGLIPAREPEKQLPHLRKAAGTKITQSQHREVVTRNNGTGA